MGRGRTGTSSHQGRGRAGKERHRGGGRSGARAALWKSGHGGHCQELSEGVHRDLEELTPEQGRRPGGWRFGRGGARPMRWEELPPGQGRDRGERGQASPLRLGPCDEERSHRGLRMRPPEGGEGLPEGRCHAGMRGRGGRRSGGWSSVCTRREGRSSARAYGAKVLGQHE
jgi:hypothetical protein